MKKLYAKKRLTKLAKGRDPVAAISFADLKNGRAKLTPADHERISRELQATHEAAKRVIDFLDRLPLARRRVGKNPLKRVGWLVNFSQREDFSDAHQLAAEVAAFIEHPDSLYDADGGEELIHPAPDDLKALSTRVHNGIARIVVAGQSWLEGPLNLRHQLAPGQKHSRPSYEGRPHHCFLAAAIQLVGAEKGKLRSCSLSICHRVFVVNKLGLRKYCSQAHSIKARYLRWREENFDSDDEFRKWRREKYAMKIHERQPGAVIQKRRPIAELAKEIVQREQQAVFEVDVAAPVAQQSRRRVPSSARR